LIRDTYLAIGIFPLYRPATGTGIRASQKERQLMKRIATTILALLLAIGFTASAAFATSGAHFMSASDSVNSAGALVANFDEAGLGNGDINYILSADATALYACINGGGNHPKAANKESFQGQLSQGGTFQAKNGRVRASLVTGPLAAPSFNCPSGQTRVLASVSYTSVVLTDTTNSVSISLADVSRTLVDLR
jgi:hypothetical protein